ncbi:hypothetical protein KK488_09970 [Sphingobium sp. H33]|uniref:Uncharacterized protein n=1 Tax=Sphingobium nicotianae TaxID=2782607 RepID=A0A9X1DC01_9SPHN|nr:hypothetical protein [Sphingobium nicotianae]
MSEKIDGEVKRSVPQPEDVTITGADWEAARRFWYSTDCLLYGSLPYQALRVREVLDRNPDQDKLTCAFASYRASVERAALLQGARLALRAAAKVAERSIARRDARLPYRASASDIETAILALLPEEAEEAGMEQWLANLEEEADRTEHSSTVRFA